jgi:hypothetical protein
MMRIARLIVVSVVTLANFVSPSAHAIEKQLPFKELMSRGFKIVATTTVANPQGTGNLVIVTMQADKSVAVCTFTIAGWEELTPAVENDAKACDVRFY